MYLDWDKDLKDEERKDQDKREDQKDSEGKTPQISSRLLLATTFTSSAPKSSIKQLSKRSSVTLEKEDEKCYTFMTLLGHESKETLEHIN